MKTIFVLFLTFSASAFALTDNAALNQIATVGIPVTAGASTSTTAETIAQARTTVTTAGTPVKLVAISTLVDQVEIFAMKSVTVANTGNIYVGISSSGGSNLMVLSPGQTWSHKAPSGKKIDLSLIYIDAATSADAVVYTSSN